MNGIIGSGEAFLDTTKGALAASAGLRQRRDMENKLIDQAESSQKTQLAGLGASFGGLAAGTKLGATLGLGAGPGGVAAGALIGGLIGWGAGELF